MIYPEFPKPGDVIGICAPSAGVGGSLESFDRSLDFLRSAGYEIAETESVRSEDYPSAPAAVRGAEFNELFEDDDIALIISATGGDYNVEMLPYIDGELVRARPKWFISYSDPTCIEMLLTSKYDIASVYGVNAGAWDSREPHEFQLNALSILGGDIPIQHSYEMYSSKRFIDDEDDYVMDVPVEWNLFVPTNSYEETSGLSYGKTGEEPLRELSEASRLEVSGRLIGGCIDVIDWVIGSPYEDLRGFAERYKEDGLIWFFDPFEITPMNLMYSMNRMKQIGLFDNARAVLFGRVCFPGEATDVDYLAELERVFADTEIPVIWGADIGHTKPSMTLINGAMAHLSFDNGRAVLEMELR